MSTKTVTTHTLITDQHYTFEQYVHDFDKSYTTEQEREERKSIFEYNYQHILTHNAATSNSGHVLHVNEFTDRKIPSELPLGYNKNQNVAYNTHDQETFVSMMQQQKPKQIQVW